MVVYADNISFADQVVPSARKPWLAPTDLRSAVPELRESLYPKSGFHASSLESDLLWRYLFIVEFAAQSHYDLLIELTRSGNALPDGILCLAGSGDKFHGFKGRPWVACPGNLHLSAHWAPARPIEHFGVAFTILAAVSVVEAIDSLPGLNGRAAIRWVNDVMIDGAKVCGVVAYTQTLNAAVTAAIVGLGLNVEAQPSVEPTRFVPRVAALRDFVSGPGGITQAVMFDKLIRALDQNYRALRDGKYAALLRRYRERSLVLGRKVTIFSEESDSESGIIAAGRVRALGENLELFLEGVSAPIWRGRLILED
jgi:BirA family biotin operon repressor/biotin-[acetyl-CoA-carboxylase] ligase